MPRTLYTPRHKALREFITAKRKEAKRTQAQLAKKVGSYQSFVADFDCLSIHLRMLYAIKPSGRRQTPDLPCFFGPRLA